MVDTATVTASSRQTRTGRMKNAVHAVSVPVIEAFK